MKDDDVAVGSDEAHVADAGVVDAHDIGTGGPDLLDRRVHVLDPERYAALVRRERERLALGPPERQRYVRRLDLAFRVRALGEPEHVAIPRHCASDVLCRDRHEVHALDVH